jgi:transcriptional regulator with XRE-family HTH domain
MKENLTIAQAFGKSLREARREARLSQPTLADRANLDRTFISQMERGIRQPTITTLFKLADGLERTPDELVKRAREIYRA